MNRKRWLLALSAGLFVALILLVMRGRESTPPVSGAGGAAGQAATHRGLSQPETAKAEATPANSAPSQAPSSPPIEQRLHSRFERRIDENPENRRVSGLVRNKVTQEPIAGAELSIQPAAGDRNLRQLSTNKEGKFKTELPASGRYEFRIAANGFAATRKERVHLQKSNFFIFELTPLMRMEGRVVDSIGSGVSGASLRTGLVGDDPYAKRTGYQTSSDSKGFFSFDSLPGPGDYSLTASHGRYGVAFQTVSLPADELIRVRMPPSPPEAALVTVRGIVRQLSGEPIAEASVILFDPEYSGMTLTSTATDLQGRFRSPPVRAGSIGVHSSAKGFAKTAQSSVSLHLDEGESIAVELVLAPEVPFFGLVSSRLGKPVVRAKVVVNLPGLGGYGAVTDENGNFSIRGATPGANELLVHQPDYLTFRGQVTLPQEGAYTIVLEEGLVLAGIAKRADGMPLKRFQLDLLEPKTGRLQQRSQVTAQNGNFEIKGLKPAAYLVRLTLAGNEVAQAQLQLSQSRNVILWLEQDRARLRIVDLGSE